METRVVIVAPENPVLADASTVTLHVYPNGEVLVRTSATSARLPEGRAAPEVAVTQGLQLDSGREAMVGNARLELQGVAASEPILAYVELIGPVDPVWLAALRGHGVEALNYHPQHSYLCQGTGAAFRACAGEPFVRDVIPQTGTLKVRVRMSEDSSSPEAVWIVARVTRGAAPALVEELAALPGVTVQTPVDAVDGLTRVRADVTARGQEAVLSHPRVVAVEPFARPAAEDEVAGLILAGQYDAAGQPYGSYLRWLEDHGLNGAGVTIGVVDSGVDVSHPAFGGRITDLAGGRRAWHGTFVAGHAAGCYLDERDPRGFIYGLGVAPGAHLLAQDNQGLAGALCRETVRTVTPLGGAGHVQNNSWGAGLQDPMPYGALE
ncbi:MAG TPA: S8 family serine peptidase, partial [Chloroflexota bacterium]|nr:S8 family serine peptidase [Chloroflexota bacterium]